MENIFIVFLNFYMINYRPILAISIILIGFLISISAAFFDELGPKIPLQKKSISDIFNTPNNVSFSKALVINSHANSAKELAEKHINQNNQVHGYSDLDYNLTLSNPENGKFTFFSAICYGRSKRDCKYLNAYIKSIDHGDTWKIGFLE